MATLFSANICAGLTPLHVQSHKKSSQLNGRELRPGHPGQRHWPRPWHGSCRAKSHCLRQRRCICPRCAQSAPTYCGRLTSRSFRMIGIVVSLSQGVDCKMSFGTSKNPRAPLKGVKGRGVGLFRTNPHWPSICQFECLLLTQSTISIDPMMPPR